MDRNKPTVYCTPDYLTPYYSSNCIPVAYSSLQRRRSGFCFCMTLRYQSLVPSVSIASSLTTQFVYLPKTLDNETTHRYDVSV